MENGSVTLGLNHIPLSAVEVVQADQHQVHRVRDLPEFVGESGGGIAGENTIADVEAPREQVPRAGKPFEVPPQS
jgi:hypothetical protein